MTEREQLDEGVRDIVIGLISTALAYPLYTKEVEKFLDGREEPRREQIQALKIAEDEIDSPNFDKIAKDLIIKLKREKQQESPGPNASPERSISRDPIPVLVKPKIKRPDNAPKLTREKIRQSILKDAAEYIIPFELYGDLNNPENDELMIPYQDDHKLWTVGVGHLIGRGTGTDKDKYIKQRKNAGKPVKLTRSEAVSMFQKDLNRVYNTLLRVFGDRWYQFPDELKVALVDIAFRGDLASKETGKLHKFVGMLKRGEYKAAADEYLDHKEYKRRIKKGEDSVVKRMNSNHAIMKSVIGKPVKAEKVMERYRCI
jgi:GH24 family phage-related lysozyme (muramidase)